MPAPIIDEIGRPIGIVHVSNAADIGGGGGSDASAANQVTQNDRIGATNATAPADDTATADINGRLQRVAQRLTSLIALLPASVGQKARAVSLPATLSTEDVALIGTEGATPPSISGTGLIGYQRALYDFFAGNPLNVVAKDSTGANITDTANTALRVHVVANSGGGSTAYEGLQIQYTPPGLSTTAYASGDAVGTAYEVVGGLKGTNPHAYVNNMVMSTGAGESTFLIEAHFFHTNPSGSTITDNAAFVYASSSMPYYCGTIQFARSVIGGRAVLRPTTTAPVAIAHATNTSFYIVLEAKGAFTLSDVNNLRVFGMIGY